MIPLKNILNFCNERTHSLSFKDFEGAYNGLQVGNNGQVSKIGASVDAGLFPFQEAQQLKVDFLIVHHGLFWPGVQMITGNFYQKIQTLFQANCALYSCHLPLDAHREIGNNALIAKALGLLATDYFLEYEGNAIAAIAELDFTREELKQKLVSIFKNIVSIEFGSKTPKKIAICSGSGIQAVSEIKNLGVDTLITGELKQNVFNYAQEEGLNLYACGHYATETFGVRALGEEVAEKFKLPFVFIETPCPL